MPRARGRTPSAEVDRRLIQAAEAVLIRDGPAGLTVRAVAAQAGVAPMTMYNRFGGKNGLVAALLLQGFERLRLAIIVRDGAAGPSRLRQACLRYRDFALANPQVYALMFQAPRPGDAGWPEMAARGAPVLDAFRASAEPAGPERGAAADSRDAAQLVWAAAHGAVALELKGLVRTADPAATYLATLETILRGLGGPAHPLRHRQGRRER